MFKNVLVPYDESEHALSALHTALDMVGDNRDAHVHVMMAIPVGSLPAPLFGGGSLDDPFSVTMPVDYDETMGAILHRARSEMEEMVERTRDGAVCDIVVDAVLATSPVEGIAEYVENNAIDLVVMGRRGLGALRGMLGSVSFGVLRSVDVPVLTVK